MSGYKMGEGGSEAVWGIAGSGKICHDFCIGLMQNKSKVGAVASRRVESAQEFQKTFADKGFSIEKAYTYKDMVNDPQITIVYIGSINTAHKEQALEAINAGKHVLLEKPMCMNVAETEEVVAAAKAKKVFLMEAMWSRFFPATQKIMEILDSGELGKVVHVKADFGFMLPMEGELSGRMWDPKMGGGASYDIGVYPLGFMMMAFKSMPISVAGAGTLAPTGVDATGGVTCTFENAGLASISWGLTGAWEEGTLIACEKGYIKIETPAHTPTAFSVVRVHESGRGFTSPEKLEFPITDLPFHKDRANYPDTNYPLSEGFLYQAQHVEECIKNGKTESDQWPFAYSLGTATILEKFRAQVGYTQ